MTSARRLVSAARSARRMIADGRGAVAIEFAFILPLMLTMMGMCIILGEALAIGQKVTATARTVTDLVSQNGQLSTTQLTTILDAAAYTMAPYPSANLSIVVSEIQTDGTGKATVTWSSAAFNGVQQAQGTVVTLPSGMAVANATYIYGYVSYAFTPPVINIGTGALTLADFSYFSPRVSATVNYPYPD